MDTTGMFPLEQSSLYRQRQEEHEAVAVHKYYLSEKAGHDVGWEYANWNWVVAGYRSRWLTARRATGVA